MSQTPAHSELGASGMHRWRNCPGSVKLSRGVPNISSTFAEEGTEAHELAASILEARKLGKREPDTFEYEDEMVDMVGLYVDHMIALGSWSPDAIQLFEHKFDLSSIFPGCFGTADGVTYYPSEQLIVVTDLKYGAGILVDVRDNPQLKYYALGAMVSLKWPIKKVRLEIVQPRTWAGDPVSAYEMDVFELWEFADEIVEAARRTQIDDTQLAVGEWCRFCPAAASGVCPLIKNQVVELAKGSLLNFDIPPIDYNYIGLMIKWAPVIKGVLSQVNEFAYQHARKGIKIPGTKLVQKRSHRNWKDEKEAYEQLSEHIDPVKMSKVKMVSPSEVERMPLADIGGLKRAALKKFVGELVIKSSSGCALVSEDDDRPEIKLIEAKSVFASTEENDAFA